MFTTCHFECLIHLLHAFPGRAAGSAARLSALKRNYAFSSEFRSARPLSGRLIGSERCFRAAPLCGGKRRFLFFFFYYCADETLQTSISISLPVQRTTPGIEASFLSLPASSEHLLWECSPREHYCLIASCLRKREVFIFP